MSEKDENKKENKYVVEIDEDYDQEPVELSEEEQKQLLEELEKWADKFWQREV